MPCRYRFREIVSERDEYKRSLWPVDIPVCGSITAHALSQRTLQLPLQNRKVPSAEARARPGAPNDKGLPNGPLFEIPWKRFAA